MTHSVPRRVGAVERDLRTRGFELDSTDWMTSATGGDDSPLDRDVPLAVAPLRSGRPLSVVSTVANAAHRGEVPVLVTDEWTRSQARSLLSDPFALTDYDDGCRQFYSVEDRITLTDGTFACVGGHGSLQWQEASSTARTESPRLELRVDGSVVAALDSVEALTCPGPEPEAFPYRYARSDGQFQVFGNEGLVATYGTITGMRRDGYRPVPLPLVPAHHVRKNPELARETLLAAVGGDGVTYEKVV